MLWKIVSFCLWMRFIYDCIDDWGSWALEGLVLFMVFLILGIIFTVWLLWQVSMACDFLMLIVSWCVFIQLKLLGGRPWWFSDKSCLKKRGSGGRLIWSSFSLHISMINSCRRHSWCHTEAVVVLYTLAIVKSFLLFCFSFVLFIYEHFAPLFWEIWRLIYV